MASTIINSDDGSSTGAAGFYLTAGDDGTIVFQSNGANVAVVTPSGPGGTPPVKFEVLGDIEASEFIGIPEGVPSGAVQYFAMDTAPTGYLKANGAAVSRSAFANLFAQIGTTYGAGDGSTTFALPDMRGEFPRGFDDGRGVDSGRAFGSAQGDAIRNITGAVSSQNNTNILANGFVFANGVFFGSGNSTRVHSGAVASNVANQTLNIDASRQVPTASENRSRNVALLACIKF